jgi:hypothetical protein
MKYLITLMILFSGCSTMNINCEYYKIENHVLKPVCVEEWEGRMPIHRERFVREHNR